MQMLVAANTRRAIAVTISTNQTDYTFTASSEPGYSAGQSDITLTVNSGIYVIASSTATAALITTGFTAGDTLTISNLGYILGKGGNGSTFTNPTIGAAGVGGTALSLGISATLDTQTGYIGGGGGGGGTTYVTAKSSNFPVYGGGGAGGGNDGSGASLGATTGGNSGATATSTQARGAGGGLIIPGTGGAGSNGSTFAVGGGSGGGGGASSASGGAGGTGNAVGGNSSATFGGGGGGGWGATGGSSGVGSPGVVTVGGAGGKAVALNANVLTLVGTSSTHIYGSYNT